MIPLLIGGPRGKAKLAFQKKNAPEKITARTYDSLRDAINLALEDITIKDISAWFNHNGHLIQSC